MTPITGQEGIGSGRLRGKNKSYHHGSTLNPKTLKSFNYDYVRFVFFTENVSVWSVEETLACALKQQNLKNVLKTFLYLPNPMKKVN